MEEKFKGHGDFIMQPGAFSWSELMTTDVPGAVEFYTKLFGWTTEEMHMEGMSYTLVKVGGTEAGVSWRPLRRPKECRPRGGSM